jgi:hypothetical protein
MKNQFIQKVIVLDTLQSEYLVALPPANGVSKKLTVLVYNLVKQISEGQWEYRFVGVRELDNEPNP